MESSVIERTTPETTNTVLGSQLAPLALIECAKEPKYDLSGLPTEENPNPKEDLEEEADKILRKYYGE